MTDNALAAAPTADTSPPGRISADTGRGRTFAVISHPDAGKSTFSHAVRRVSGQRDLVAPCSDAQSAHTDVTPLGSNCCARQRGS
jgi:hypothetical protein